MRDVADGRGAEKRIISRKSIATAAAPNTTRSPTNRDRIAMETAMKMTNRLSRMVAASCMAVLSAFSDSASLFPFLLRYRSTNGAAPELA